MTVPTKIPRSPVERWQAAYAQQPLDALDRLLLGRVYMGRLHRNDADEIIFRLFHRASDEDLARLDETLQRWFATNWGQAPTDLSVSRWDQVLQNAFSVAVRLNLPQTQVWLPDHRDSGRRWLRTLYLDPSRDPEAAFLRTLALGQRDTRLLPLWMALCRMEEDRPMYFGGLALLGLRKLPDENGEPHADLHPAVFRGIVELADALDRQVRPRKDGERYWLVEMRAFMARYPRSQTYWAEHFWPHLRYHRDSAAAAWLGKLIHPLKRALEGGRLRSAGYAPARSPSKDDTDTIVDLLWRNPLGEVRLALTNFLQKHRTYAEETGHADVLVKVFRRIVSILWKKDTAWALRLMLEAFDWAPYDPRNWTQLATLEARVGKQKQALHLLWKAKRRFPENAIVRNQLANLLMRQKRYEVAELVYRETKVDFPDNVVCRNGLAEVLKAQRRYEEAEAEYRETKADFPDDDVCRNGLAEVLKAQRRYEEAEVEYRETKEHSPDNVVCRTGLAEVLKVQGKLEEAEAEYREAKADFPDDVVCRTGLAVVLVLQGKRDESIRELEETIKKFPDNPVARSILEKVEAREMDAAALASAYETVSEEAEEASLTPQIDREFRPSTVESAEPAGAEQEVALPAEGARPEEEKAEAVSPVFSEAKEEVAPSAEEAPPEEEKIEAVSAEPAEAEGEIASASKEARSVDEEIDLAVEADLGLAAVYRFAALQAEGTTQTRYWQTAEEASERALTADPGNLYALLGRGFGMLHTAPEDAEGYFTHQIEEGKREHVAGFQLGRVQARMQRGETVPAETWKELRETFENQRTLITLEEARHGLHHRNGITQPALEELRKHLRSEHAVETLPGSLQNLDKWVREIVKTRMFAGVALAQPLTEREVVVIAENVEQHGAIVQGVVEHSLSVFE